MKKLLVLLAVMFTLVSCKCSHIKENVGINVEEINQADYNYMSENYGDFKWYECEILLNDFLNKENDGTIAELVNVFQVNDSINSQVYKFQHFPDGTTNVDSIMGFYVENLNMTLEDITIPYDSAYSLIMSVNYPKPESRHVTIRKPLGPQICNTQYIFGNKNSQLWVDAFTGEVKTSNPAFPNEQ